MHKSIIVFLAFTAIISLSFLPSKKLTWVAIGDSITYLNEHADEAGNRITKGYMTMVKEQLTDITYYNQGHNGWTSGGIADKIESLGIQKADIYSIFLGTNDWWSGRPVGTLEDYTQNKGNQTIYGSFRIITDKLKKLNKKAQIILITPLQRGDFVYLANMKNNAYGSYKDKNGQSLSDVVNAIKAIGAHEKFAVVDLYNDSGITLENMVKFKRLKNPDTGVYQNYPYPDYLKIPFNPETDEYPYPSESVDMTYDGLHPSDKGYVAITNMLLKVIRKK